MNNKEAIKDVPAKDSLLINIGGMIVNKIDNAMTPPITGETSNGFKRVVGGTALVAATVVGYGSMMVLDEITGMGTNPLNYAISLHRMTTY